MGFEPNQIMIFMGLFFSLIGSVIAKPESFGLIGMLIIELKSSDNTKIKKEVKK